MNIIRARAQMVERHGFHPIFFLRTADHGVESEAGVFLALDHPSLTMFGRDDLRLLALIFWRNVPNEHVGGFTDMVVYAHENHFVDFHRCLSTCWKRSEEHTSELQSLLLISYAVLCLKTKQRTYKMSTLSL